MNINIQGTHIELTDSIRDYLDKRIAGLDKMVDSETAEANAQVELGRTSSHHKSGDVFRAEINITVEGKYLRAVSEKEDLYSAIDDMKDEIFREVKKHKDRHRSLVRRGSHRMKNMMRGLFGRNRNK